MSCECGCEYCCEDEPEWDGTPVPPPAEGTIERALYDVYGKALVRELGRRDAVWKLFNGR